MKLYTDHTGFSPAEIEFLSENTEIDVIPTEKMDDVQLISVGSFGMNVTRADTQDRDTMARFDPLSRPEFPFGWE